MVENMKAAADSPVGPEGALVLGAGAVAAGAVAGVKKVVDWARRHGPKPKSR
jgi:hypothetical protein